MKIAALVTTFNRKDKTLSCLKHVFAQELSKDDTIEVFLTDDGSSDNTAEAVRRDYPSVHIYEGSGNLYWAGGLRHSWNKARANGCYDFFFLINDDTTLEHDALSRLVSLHNYYKWDADLEIIAIGSTKDAETGKISYGGKKLNSKNSPKYTTVFSDSQPQECDFGNANIMLVPDKIVDRVGILAEKYIHGIADYDYTQRAQKLGFKSIVAPGVLGFCHDDHGHNWMPQKSGLRARIKYLYHPKGLAYNEYLYFIRCHFPGYYPIAVSKLWLKTLFPFLWGTFKK